MKSPRFVRDGDEDEGDRVESRTRAQRRAVRFPVRFWRLDDVDRTYAGVVTNVSPGGAFIATGQVQRPNVPIAVEIVQPDGPRTVSADVVHAARYPALYQRVFRSGMGIRFHEPEAPLVQNIAQLCVPLSDRGGRRRFPRAV